MPCALKELIKPKPLYLNDHDAYCLKKVQGGDLL